MGAKNRPRAVGAVKAVRKGSNILLLSGVSLGPSGKPDSGFPQPLYSYLTHTSEFPVALFFLAAFPMVQKPGNRDVFLTHRTSHEPL